MAMFGFMPGFPYLAGLPESLCIPRKNSPRKIVPAGSVAIANDRCGIYPHDSPGGWHIIGRTPINIFDIHSTSPSKLELGQSVLFKAIDISEFDLLQND